MNLMDKISAVARAITRARILRNPAAYSLTPAGNFTPDRLESIVDAQAKYAHYEAEAAVHAMESLKEPEPEQPQKKKKSPSSRITSLASRILRGGEYTHEEVKSLAACALALDPVKGQD